MRAHTACPAPSWTHPGDAQVGRPSQRVHASFGARHARAGGVHVLPGTTTQRPPRGARQSASVRQPSQTSTRIGSDGVATGAP